MAGPYRPSIVGSNHPRYGKEVSLEVRYKISKKLVGRSLSLDHRNNISKSHNKKAVYCYDYVTGEFVVEFSGIRPMCRALNLCSTVQIVRKLDNGKPFSITYLGRKVTWSLRSTVDKFTDNFKS